MRRGVILLPQGQGGIVERYRQIGSACLADRRDRRSRRPIGRLVPLGPKFARVHGGYSRQEGACGYVRLSQSGCGGNPRPPARVELKFRVNGKGSGSNLTQASARVELEPDR